VLSIFVGSVVLLSTVDVLQDTGMMIVPELEFEISVKSPLEQY
jgi:hypothetical protein